MRGVAKPSYVSVRIYTERRRKSVLCYCLPELLPKLREEPKDGTLGVPSGFTTCCLENIEPSVDVGAGGGLGATSAATCSS